MTRWLNEDEQRAWRAFLKGANRLLEHLDDSLRGNHDLALTDFEILVVLSEAPTRRLRMSDIADRVLVSRSRLTYRVDRLVERGLVVRSEVAGDGRGMNAELTAAGSRTPRIGGEDPRRGCRIGLMAHISPDELGVFTRIWTSVSDQSPTPLPSRRDAVSVDHRSRSCRLVAPRRARSRAASGRCRRRWAGARTVLTWWRSIWS